MDNKVLVVDIGSETHTVHIPDIEKFTCLEAPNQAYYEPPKGRSLIETFVKLNGTMRMKDGREFDCSFVVDGGIEHAINNAPFKIERP